MVVRVAMMLIKPSRPVATLLTRVFAEIAVGGAVNDDLSAEKRIKQLKLKKS